VDLIGSGIALYDGTVQLVLFYWLNSNIPTWGYQFGRWSRCHISLIGFCVLVCMQELEINHRAMS